MGPLFESSSHFSEWLAMNPMVQCDDGVMTFTASGKAFRHLFVDRGKRRMTPHIKWTVLFVEYAHEGGGVGVGGITTCCSGCLFLHSFRAETVNKRFT